MITLVLAALTGTAQQPFEKAQWITASFPENLSPHPCPVFKKEFHVAKKLQSAILYVTAHGIYEARLNNQRIGEAYLAPGWTNYFKRLQYQQYDVSKMLRKQNNIEITVADGWYSGVFGGDLNRNRYGSDVSVLCELHMRFSDGTEQVMVSDPTWLYTASAIYSSIYDGETVDTRGRKETWAGVALGNFRKDILVPANSEPVTKGERFRPVRIIGDTLIDFGQNLAGWVQLKIKGKAGDSIKVEHAEALDKEGRFYTGNLREAKATDLYILNGSEQVLEPKFTYHGFRYAKVNGFRPSMKNCQAIALHSALKHTGTFQCSDPLINQLQHNIEWSLNSNFVDIPTDCPQRSERLGWTGDAQVFARTAAFNRDISLFFRRWLADLAADQGSNGAVPSIIPDLYRSRDTAKNGRAGWGDAATIIPWTLFEIYGDTSVLRDQYPTMKAWVDYIQSVSQNGIWTNYTYGDWYAPGDSTSTYLVNQCFFGYSTQLLINTAGVLNRRDDVRYYSALLEKIKLALLENYFDEKGRAITHTQTAYILPLQFQLLPDPIAEKAVGHLVDLIHKNGDHLATGFLGTPYILHVLSRYGYNDLAYTILNQTTPPSWLYPVTKGATTIWEKWQAVRPDNSFDTCSLNHYAYGAVGDWLYSTIGGLTAMEPGYKKIRIAPHPGGGLTWANLSYACSFGKIVSNWKLKNGFFYLTVEIPQHTTAEIQMPGDELMQLGPGSYRFKRRYEKK